jgi:cadmium resistance protein CadD (predicted permease)
MGEIVATTILGVLAFTATNLDDLAVLTAYLAAKRVTMRQAARGQVAGMVLVMGLSAAAALGAVWIPAAWLHWIGLLPLAIGAKQLIQSLRRAIAGLPSPVDPPVPRARGVRVWSGEATIAALVVANSGDNLGVYAALFTAQSPFLSAIQIFVALAMAAGWAWLAARLVDHPTLGAPLRRGAPWALPWVLILLGLGIVLL